MLKSLEKSPGSTASWRGAETCPRCGTPDYPTQSFDFLTLAIRTDEPEIFRYFVRFQDPPENWADWALKLLKVPVHPRVMGSFLKILCEEGIFWWR